MISFFKTYFWLLIPIFLVFQIRNSKEDGKIIQHQIDVKHPGEKLPFKVVLNQIIDKNGLPTSYFMDVKSVICLEQVCKVIPVRIYWNNLGAYQKYVLEEGATLEKYEDDLFSDEDYPKLHSVLSNSNSPFKEVYIEDILTVVDEHNDESDAVSGATALELDEKDTVPGAALTCYTLWHWANGEIVQQIKQITGSSISDVQLQEFIVDKNSNYFVIALKELADRKNYSKSIIKVIIKKVLEDESLLRSTFDYLEKAPSEIYFSTLKELFLNGGKEQKLAVIRSLKSIKYTISNDFFDAFSNQIATFDSYHELSFFLDILQAKNISSDKIIENVLPILKSDFIKARRAYWFLKNQKLTSEQQEVLNAFYIKNKEKL